MRIFLVIVIALTVSACGGDSSPTAPTPAPIIIVQQTPAPTPQPTGNPNVIGEWTGTLRSQSGSTRAIRLTIVGAYSSTTYLLSGTWSFIGTNEGSTLSGLVQSNPFELRINASTASAAWCSYNTTLNATGNSISGNYATSVCFGRTAETGTVSLSR